LQVSADGGNTWDVPVKTLDKTAGIGDAVTPGTGKLIVWDAKADWPGKVSNQVRFKVNATDTPVPPAPAGFALIPAGSFQMGDALDGDTSAPVHTVNVSAFYMEKNLVTKEQWDEVRARGLNNGYTDLDVGNGSYASKGANHPVHSITWYAMVKWCNARSRKEGFTECYTVGGSVYKTGQSAPVLNMSASGYRLPTEAEWEKAARGGLSGKRFPWGDTISRSQANYYGYTGYGYDLGPDGFNPTYATGNYPYTSPVGSFAANGYGLYDMAGNLWQWCWDWYGAYGSGSASDPTGPASGSIRVGRGGGWDDGAGGCRVASRIGNNPAYSNRSFGFRCARSSVP
jgi:formylglycine-generating enzyme required for sulfatase activity